MLPPLVSQSTTSRGAGLGRGLHGLQGVVAVLLPAVEEMLGVEDHLAAGADADRPRCRAIMARFSSQRGPQHLGDVEGRGLADQRDDGRAGIAAGPSAGVGFGLGVLAAGHAEGADLGVLQAQLADALKVLEVLVVRGGIAPLDVIEARARRAARSSAACPGARS